MNKQEFLARLSNGLRGLPQAEIRERLLFYREMIDDRTEEGFTEEQAVADIGSVDDIIAQVIAETPFLKIAKERITPKRRLKVWEIILLSVGSPLWLSLGIAAVAVILSLYISCWAVIVSLWAVFGSLIGVGATGILLVFCGNGLAGIALFGGGLVCFGISIFAFIGSKAATDGILSLTK